MPDYVNTVPQGQIGTGNAQVFGVNPLANQFAGQLGNLRKEQQLQAQQLAKAWRDNQLAASSGSLWAADMAGIEKNFIDRGIELQKKGVNPYGSSPEALEYQRDKRYVQAQQGYRKSIEDRVKDAMTKINANPDKYDPKSIQGLHDFISKTKLTDAFENNIDIPALQERFDVAEYLKPYKALTQQNSAPNAEGTRQVDEKVMDEVGTQNMLIGALARDPRGQNYLQELTSGFQIPDVKAFAPTYAENVKMVKEYISGNPRERERLAAQGILPNTPMMEEYISDLAQTQTAAKKKFDTGMKDLVSAAGYDLDLFKKETPIKNDLSDENLAERIRHNKAMEAKKRASGEGGGVPAPAKDLTFTFGETKDGKRASFTGKETVALNTPTLNMHGTQVIDAATGKQIKIADSSNDFALAELTHAPVLTKDVTIRKSDGSTERLKAGSLVQDNFANKNPSVIEYKKMGVVQKPRPGGKFSTYYIDADLIPTNTFSKKTQAEYDRFKATPAPSGQSASAQSSDKTTPTKTTIRIELNGHIGEVPADQVPLLMKKYPQAKRLD